MDTASFQRLRHIKQLGMAHLVYPNAMHTRFAHSLGALGTIERLMATERCKLSLKRTLKHDLRLAALLHDVGHYPYSHLMEGIDKIELAEELIEGPGGSRQAQRIPPYPKHGVLSRIVITAQSDLLDALGGPRRARKVADLIDRRHVANFQVSNLISSSLDLDRFDYLLRDSMGTGVPYGHIDLHYLLNNIRASPRGLLAVPEKALPAVERFLFARYFIHRVVYYHKTVFGFEEACRQLMRRLRDRGGYEGPPDGDAIVALAKSKDFVGFTDAWLDQRIQRATAHNDRVIAALATCLQTRRPPRLLKEVQSLAEMGATNHAQAKVFRVNCRHSLRKLANDNRVELGQFMLCQTKPLSLEDRPARMTAEQARDRPPEEEDPIVKVFLGDDTEPTSIVDVPHSIIGKCSGFTYQSHRLYFVPASGDPAGVADELRERVKGWDKAD